VDAPEIRNAIYIKFAQTINLRSSAFICGSFFTRAPDINRSEFINIWCANYSSAHEPTSSDNWCRKIANKHISMTENKKRNKINENI
jgi:hypothetical protein